MYEEVTQGCGLQKLEGQSFVSKGHRFSQPCYCSGLFILTPSFRYRCNNQDDGDGGTEANFDGYFLVSMLISFTSTTIRLSLCGSTSIFKHLWLSQKMMKAQVKVKAQVPVIP